MNSTQLHLVADQAKFGLGITVLTVVTIAALLKILPWALSRYSAPKYPTLRPKAGRTGLWVTGQRGQRYFVQFD